MHSSRDIHNLEILVDSVLYDDGEEGGSVSPTKRLRKRRRRLVGSPKDANRDKVEEEMFNVSQLLKKTENFLTGAFDLPDGHQWQE